MLKCFFDWYNRHYQFNLRFATALFLLQLVHLFWLTGNVVLVRLFDLNLFPHQLDWLLALIDYIEIPTLISVSLIYINDLMLGKNSVKAWLYLIILNSQWLHLFWITDEVIIQNFTGQTAIVIPAWLAWIAILIDYLELPVMWDTAKKALRSK